jgi:hypothetical protein
VGAVARLKKGRAAEGWRVSDRDEAQATLQSNGRAEAVKLAIEGDFPRWTMTTRPARASRSDRS